MNTTTAIVYRQTRIFVPNSVPFDNDSWAETLLGNVLRPAAMLASALEWFWFSRYVSLEPESAGDCDIKKIPNACLNPEYKLYRSLRVRYAGPLDTVRAFESTCEPLITHVG